MRRNTSGPRFSDVVECSLSIEGFETTFPEGELFQTEGAVAVFIPKSRADDARAFLSRFGFAQAEIPEGSGDPAKLLAAAEADEAKWRERLKEVETRLEKLREKYASFVVAAEEALEVELEKAEAPLRFAASEHSFVVDGWVPAAKFAEFSGKVSALGVHVEALGEAHDHHETEPPVLLKNPKPARPLEFLIQLYSTPSYHELDPTVFMFIAFPFFFGFMIGDVGYGFFFLLLGVVSAIKMKKGDLRNLFIVIGMGGFGRSSWGCSCSGRCSASPSISHRKLRPKSSRGRASASTSLSGP